MYRYIVHSINKASNMWQLLSSPMNEGSLCLLPHQEISGSGSAREKESADHLSCVTPRQPRSILTLGVFVGLIYVFKLHSDISAE